MENDSFNIVSSSSLCTGKLIILMVILIWWESYQELLADKPVSRHCAKVQVKFFFLYFTVFFNAQDWFSTLPLATLYMNGKNAFKGYRKRILLLFITVFLTSMMHSIKFFFPWHATINRWLYKLKWILNLWYEKIVATGHLAIKLWRVIKCFNKFQQYLKRVLLIEVNIGR